MRPRNTIFIIVLALVLLGPTGICASRGLGIQLPELIDPATAEYLEGNKTEIDLNGAFSVDGVLSGRAQNSIDAIVADNIPAKATVLFTNAALQRGVIETSNTFFDWPCYQTYFNSDYVWIPEYNAIVETPYADDGMSDGLIEFSNRIDAFAADNPQLKVEILLVDRASTSASNVASQLMSDRFTTAMALDLMREHCTAGNVQVSSYCYESPDEFFKDFYKSDHHWNPHGVLKGMNALYGDLDDSDTIKVSLAEIAAYGTREVEGPGFSGSCVRNGLYPLEVPPMDLAYDFSALSFHKGDNSFSGSTHTAYWQASELNEHYQFYDLYYKGGTEVNGAGTENALMISDSFGSAFQWPLAECYATLWTSNDLHYYSKSDKRLSDLCDLPECDKIIFVGCILNYSNFLERNPHMFD